MEIKKEMKVGYVRCSVGLYVSIETAGYEVPIVLWWQGEVMDPGS